jgi:uncharacterized protein (TIGR02145 family)
VYKTIVIGTQEWMAENLNTSVYRNGDVIPTGLSNVEWENTINTQQGAWAYVNNDPSYACPYGKLYNWYTCADSRGLCPVSWHVPTDAEWSVLTMYLGGGGVAGGKMKTAGTIEATSGLWFSPNIGATNSSGFSGAPGGFRNSIGDWGYIGYLSEWWSSSEDGALNAWDRAMFHNYSSADRFNLTKHFGLSVRCLRD